MALSAETFDRIIRYSAFAHATRRIYVRALPGNFGQTPAVIIARRRSGERLKKRHTDTYKLRCPRVSNCVSGYAPLCTFRRSPTSFHIYTHARRNARRATSLRARTSFDNFRRNTGTRVARLSLVGRYITRSDGALSLRLTYERLIRFRLQQPRNRTLYSVTSGGPTRATSCSLVDRSVSGNGGLRNEVFLYTSVVNGFSKKTVSVRVVRRPDVDVKVANPWPRLKYQNRRGFVVIINLKENSKKKNS